MQYTTKTTAGKLILFATILASGMGFLDGTVVSIATPQIQSSLHTDLKGIQWLTDSFALALASLIIVSGSLGDKFGRRKVFTLGIGLFTASSALCAFSNSIEQLIAARTLQGIGSAMMIPGSLAIINSSFAENNRGKAIGLWSGFAGGVASLGPLLGGYLVQFFNWQYIFFINVPIGILALFISLKYVPESRNAEAKGVDFIGTILITLALLGISFGLIEGPGLGWMNSKIVFSLVTGVVSFLAFLRLESKQKHPLVPLHIFAYPLVRGANLVTFFLYFALYGMLFFLVLNFRQVQGYSSFFTGLGLLPFGLILTFLSGYGGTLADKLGPRIPMIIGPFMVAISFALLALPGVNVNYFVSFLPALILFGLGMSLVIAPLTKSALSAPEKYSGAASGVNNAVSRIAALLAVAILGAVVITLFKTNLNPKIQGSDLKGTQKQQLTVQMDRLGAMDAQASFDETAKNEATVMIKDSFVYSFRWAMWICAALALLSSLISVATIKNPKKVN